MLLFIFLFNLIKQRFCCCFPPRTMRGFFVPNYKCSLQRFTLREVAAFKLGSFHPAKRERSRAFSCENCGDLGRRFGCPVCVCWWLNVKHLLNFGYSRAAVFCLLAPVSLAEAQLKTKNITHSYRRLVLDSAPSRNAEEAKKSN
jgi:hypothetical protein